MRILINNIESVGVTLSPALESAAVGSVSGCGRGAFELRVHAGVARRPQKGVRLRRALDPLARDPVRSLRAHRLQHRVPQRLRRRRVRLPREVEAIWGKVGAVGLAVFGSGDGDVGEEGLNDHLKVVAVEAWLGDDVVDGGPVLVGGGGHRGACVFVLGAWALEDEVRGVAPEGVKGVDLGDVHHLHDVDKDVAQLLRQHVEHVLQSQPVLLRLRRLQVLAHVAAQVVRADEHRHHLPRVRQLRVARAVHPVHEGVRLPRHVVPARPRHRHVESLRPAVAVVHAAQAPPRRRTLHRRPELPQDVWNRHRPRLEALLAADAPAQPAPLKQVREHGAGIRAEAGGD
mmetsp:Transcript_11554/g.37975  ORF Transcript_11554/g.37975 Transcript_11554/m.37975 type:complete len:344 (-) Transcript_11554:236-1267(-)